MGPGRIIYSMRKERGISQSLLADRAGISQECISKIERGKSDPRLGTLCSIAKALDVTPQSIITIALDESHADVSEIGILTGDVSI